MFKVRLFGPDICRVCLEPSKRLQPIDETREEGEETPNEMLIQLLGASFSKLNGKEHIPDSICKTCKVELNMAYQFREKALCKQIEIEQFCREAGVLTETKTVLVKEEEHLRTHDEDDMEYMLDDTELVDVKEYSEAEANDQTETITGHIEYLDDNYMIEISPEQEEVVNESVNVIESKMNLLASCQPVKIRRRGARKGELRTAEGTEKGGYICDVCGNFYEKRGRMMEHRRRHDAVCQYQCELCDAKFQVREQLRKHMYSHTGSKPFKCSFCSRQFFYESVLKAHENVHRGVKPYVCKVCDKAFAYAHSLTKHSLIHDDIKLYRCDYCNKDFRLLHHMRQHEDTKCHQNAVILSESMKYENQQEEELEVLHDDEELKHEHAEENYEHTF